MQTVMVAIKAVGFTALAMGSIPQELLVKEALEGSYTRHACPCFPLGCLQRQIIRPYSQGHHTTGMRNQGRTELEASFLPVNHHSATQGKTKLEKSYPAKIPMKYITNLSGSGTTVKEISAIFVWIWGPLHGKQYVCGTVNLQERSQALQGNLILIFS